MQIEDVLGRRGWRVAERRTLAVSGWLDEVWTIESEWAPVGAKAYISFVIARESPGGLSRRAGEALSSVAVSTVEPTEASFGFEVYLRPSWERQGLPQFIALIDGLRRTPTAG
jgi:hypothetical protein